MISKRRRFIIISAILSIGLLVTQFVSYNLRYWLILGLTLLAYFLPILGFWEDFKKTAWITILPLPAIYAGSVALFYFLLPQAFLTRISILLFFGVGMYAILLSGNIFLVAAIRTIQLSRAAQAVDFLMTLISAFFLYDTIFSFKLAGWWNGFLIGFLSFFLILPACWNVLLEESVSRTVMIYGLVLSLLQGELSFFISFWPVTIPVYSLFLVTGLYVGLGLAQNQLVGRLFKKTIYEYLQVGVIIFIITFLLARWG